MLLVADRVGAVVAADAVASQLQVAGDLDRQPSVSIRGFPFLTQVLGGRYSRIDLTATDLRRTSLRLERLDVAVHGARVPLSRALSGRVQQVPVESLTATALVSYGDLATSSDLAEAQITPAGRQVELTARTRFLDAKVQVRCRSEVSLDHGDLLLTPRTISVDGHATSNALLLEQLRVRIDIGRLPYGLQLTGVAVTRAGVELRARTGQTVLRRP